MGIPVGVQATGDTRDVALATRRAASAAVGLAALTLAVLWLLDLYALRTRVLTTYRGTLPLTPLYAFWNPALRFSAIYFVVACTATVALAPLACDPARVGKTAFAFALAAFAVLLPWALFLVRQPARELGSQFLIYPDEEFLWDASRIGALAPFLEHYVELMPELSLHGRHFPPGNAVLLYLVAGLFGRGPFPAGCVVLALFAAAILAVYAALARLTVEAVARQGALLALAAPSLLDFACTSMDAVFLLFASLAWWASLGAFEPQAGPRRAIVSGTVLLLATFFSFSALPLGLVVLLYALWANRRSLRHAVRQLAWTGGAYAAGGLALWTLTAFSLWGCLRGARRSALALITQILHGPPSSQWANLSYGNASAFLIGSGVALLAACTFRLGRGGPGDDRWSAPALVGLSIMAFGGLYFMETERIWLFAIPWLAAVGMRCGPFRSETLRILLGAGFAQALAMEASLFTLW